MTEPPNRTSRGYALLALGVALFTVYGSLVPFDLRHRSWSNANAEFEQTLAGPLRMASKTDFAANLLLGVPLGFCILGAVRVDRPGFLGSVLAALVIWPWCLGLALGVEFAQLYAPGRSCTLADIVAQSFGSLLGLIGWLLLGTRFTNLVRRAWNKPRAGGAVGKMLLAYLGVIVLIQMLPLDVSPSPKMVYDRFRDGRVEVVPFASWSQLNVTITGKAGTACELIGLFLPAGLLAARLPGRFARKWSDFPLVAFTSFGFALLTECGQLVVSRQPSMTDALWGMTGGSFGWFIGRGLQAIRTEPGIALEPVLILSQFWLALLVVANWHPFQFANGFRQGVTNWVPFADSTAKNYLAGLDEILLKTVLYLPLGVLIAGSGRTTGGWPRLLLAAGFGILAAAVLEFGQVFIPGRYPSVTDVLLAAIGSGCGAIVTRRLRTIGGPL